MVESTEGAAGLGGGDGGLEDSSQPQYEEQPTVLLPDHTENVDLMNAVLFWVLVLAAMFMIYRSWDTIKASLNRLFSSEEENSMAFGEKLSGGDDLSAAP